MLIRNWKTLNPIPFHLCCHYFVILDQVVWILEIYNMCTDKKKKRLCNHEETLRSSFKMIWMPWLSTRCQVFFEIRKSCRSSNDELNLFFIRMKRYRINFIWLNKCTFLSFLFSSKTGIHNKVVWTALLAPSTGSNDAGQKICVKKKKKIISVSGFNPH